MKQRDGRTEFDVVVVGAGPAGMMAAITAARAGACTAICEQMDRPGLKLLATGGGRCNLTNTADADSFMSRFGREGRFMQPALGALSPEALRTFFRQAGMPTIAPDGVRVYPSTESSATVCNAMVDLCTASGAALWTGTTVSGLVMEDRAVRGVNTSAGTLAARAVILATGGKSYPGLGATGTGYDLARGAGHHIAPALPALVPLVTAESWPRQCAGVSIRNTRVRIDLPGRKGVSVSGDLLFTHRGISGPGPLDLSREIVVLLEKAPHVPIRIALRPDLTRDQCAGRMDDWKKNHGKRRIVTLLGQELPASLAHCVAAEAGISGEATAASLRREQRDVLAAFLVEAPLTVTGTEGFAHAMVTRGGVRLKEIDPATLQSRLVEGLFLAGEIVDLDGPCGGFNLQWAFSSGHLAGRSAAHARDQR